MQHPCIPRIYEAQIDPQNQAYVTFVMESVGDSDAGPVVLGQDRPLSIEECVRIGLDLLSALDFLHVTEHVLHRDIQALEHSPID